MFHNAFFPGDPECPNLLCARPWEQRAHWKNCGLLRIPLWSLIHSNHSSFLLSEKVLASVSWDKMLLPLCLLTASSDFTRSQLHSHWSYWVTSLVASSFHSASVKSCRVFNWKQESKFQSGFHWDCNCSSSDCVSRMKWWSNFLWCLERYTCTSRELPGYNEDWKNMAAHVTHSVFPNYFRPQPTQPVRTNKGGTNSVQQELRHRLFFKHQGFRHVCMCGSNDTLCWGSKVHFSGWHMCARSNV